MKRLVILLAVLLVGCQLSAQSRGNCQLVGGVSLGFYDRFIGLNSEITDGSYSSSINGVKSEYAPVVLPTFGLTAIYDFPGTRVGAGIDTAWSYAYSNLKGGPSLLQERELIVHILPQIRFYYLKKDDVRLYGAVGIGGRYRKFTEDYENDPISNRDLKLTFQIIPFGMDVGNQWFFNMDIGDGLAWSYARIGMGYRF